MILQRDEIINYIMNNKDYLKQKFHLKKIGIFGSFARNEQTEKSDIDLILDFQDKTEKIFELKEEIRNLFKEKFHKNVDIATEKYLKPYIKQDILKETIYVE